MNDKLPQKDETPQIEQQMSSLMHMYPWSVKLLDILITV